MFQEFCIGESKPKALTVSDFKMSKIGVTSCESWEFLTVLVIKYCNTDWFSVAWNLGLFLLHQCLDFSCYLNAGIPICSCSSRVICFNAIAIYTLLKYVCICGYGYNICTTIQATYTFCVLICSHHFPVSIYCSE